MKYWLPSRYLSNSSSYALVLVVSAVSLGVSGLPSPLYRIYEEEWNYSDLVTTIIFAVYAVAALGGIFTAGIISDKLGRKPLLFVSLVAIIAGLLIFIFAVNIWMLLLARIIHGFSIGSVVVVAAAALLDLAPQRGAQSGKFSGISFNIGMGSAILGSTFAAEYSKSPLTVPYWMAIAVNIPLIVGLVAIREPLTVRVSGPLRLAKPAVPKQIAAEFNFSSLGAAASWSVLGVLLSLFPALASSQVHTESRLFGGFVVATVCFAAAAAQAISGEFMARRVAIFGDYGLAAAMIFSVLALNTHTQWIIFVAAAAVGATFGFSFGGSLRYLSAVVPAAHRGETMAAFYLIAYAAMAVPTVCAGWAAAQWSLSAVYPYFAAGVALACLVAGVLGTRARPMEQ